MKERPILFSGPMVRAILEGRKTQTRRIIKASTREKTVSAVHYPTVPTCQYGVPGDRLWVKETWCHIGSHSGPHTAGKVVEDVRYRADVGDGYVWRPSIFMPRWASRITLEIEAVRVERLIEITAEDCIAEGIVNRESWTMDGPSGLPWMQPEGAYRELWESINGPGSWDLNPWVWVIQFRRIKP